MKCTECGKEIPEDKTLCDECEKKNLTDVSNEKETTADSKEEQKEEKKKEEKKPKKEKKKKEDKKEDKKTDEFKVSKSSEEKNNSKLNIVVLLGFVLILVAIAVLIGFKLFGSSSKIGNSIGNIRNYGYGTFDGNWIYYLSPNEDSTKVGIYKVKNNGEDKKELLMNDLDIVSINAYKNYVYFIGIGQNAYSDTDNVDNKIYRMKNDGSDLEVINDNEFNNDCYEIYAVNNAIYYIGIDSNIYKMDLNGTNREAVSENGTGYIGITSKYIIYNANVEGSEDYVTYIMNLDGSDARPIVENTRLYSVDVKGNYVYYTDSDKKIYRTRIDSGEQELVLDTTAYNLNLKEDYLYFLNYADAENEDYTVCLYRVKTDGSEEQAEKIKELSTYSSYIDIVGDWVMYMDSDDNSGFINLVKLDGSEELKLYVLDYEKYYEEMEETNANPEETTAEGTDTNQEQTTSSTDETNKPENVDTTNTLPDTNVVNTSTPDTTTSENKANTTANNEVTNTPKAPANTAQ